MNQVRSFSIRKLKVGVVSVTVGLSMMMTHQAGAEEYKNKNEYEDSVSPENQNGPEIDVDEYDIIAEDEVIIQGEDYDITDNIFLDSEVPVIDVIDITDERLVDVNTPGYYPGLLLIILENGEEISQEINIIVEVSEDLNEPPEVPEKDDEERESDGLDNAIEDDEESEDLEDITNSDEDDESGDIRDDTEASEDEGDIDGPDEGRDIEDNTEDKIDSDEDTKEKPEISEDEIDVEDSDEGQEADDYPEGTEETEDLDVFEIPNDEDVDDIEGSEEVPEGLEDEYDETEEIIPPENEADPEIPDENEFPEDTWDEPSEGLNTAENELYERDETSEAMITEMQDNGTEAYLDQYLTDDEVSEVLSDINFEFKRFNNEDEMKRELTRTLIKYLSDLQKENEFQAVAPPISRMMTKSNNQGKSLDSLYPLNLERLNNKGDFTTDARVEWIAIANYTRSSITPNHNPLFLLDGNNPGSAGHFEIHHSEYVDAVSGEINPLWTLTIATAVGLENINVVLQAGIGPDGLNWSFTEDNVLSIESNETFMKLNDIAVAKRFGTSGDMTERNFDSYVDTHKLNMKISRLNAGEHVIVSITGTPLIKNGVQQKEYFIADGRLSADYIS